MSTAAGRRVTRRCVRDAPKVSARARALASAASVVLHTHTTAAVDSIDDDLLIMIDTTVDVCVNKCIAS
jgi:hypothetical protein